MYRLKSAPQYHKPATKPKSTPGFTLLEVLITVVILSIALFGIIRATQQTVKTTHYLHTKITADLVAQDVMARVRAHLFGTEQQGDMTLLGQNWQWQLEQHKTALPHLMLLKVTVQKNNTPLATIVTYAAVHTPGKHR